MKHLMISVKRSGVHRMVALAYDNRGVIQSDRGDHQEAIEDFTRAIEIDAQLYAAWYHRGLAWEKLDDFDNALSDYSQVVQINPKHVEAYFRRGQIHERLEAFEDAIADYEAAIDENEKASGVLNTLAWLLATCKDEKCCDGQLAVTYATRACEVAEWKNASYIDTLAASYAQTGDFDKAIEFQKKAVALASASQRAEFQSRLDLFNSGRAYRADSEEKQ